jgi:hypothetical protein
MSPMESPERKGISPETISLTLIALVDCSTTLWLIESGLAVEGNPVVRFYIEKGWVWFFALKLAVLLPMYIIDLRGVMDRRRMRLYLRAAVLIYASIYGLGMLAQYKRFAQKPASATPNFSLSSSVLETPNNSVGLSIADRYAASSYSK